jgi:hypothetical protein
MTCTGEAETGMVIEDKDDEGASGSGSGDRQSGMDLGRQDGDRRGESEGNSRATSRQRLGGGGKAGVLT